MVAAPLAGGAVDVVTARGEEPLPMPLATGRRVLPVEGIWERDGARASAHILGVLVVDPREV